MTLTPEEQHQHQRLERQIGATMAARGYLEDGELVTDWAVVVATAHMDDPSAASYTLLFPNGDMAAHTAIGLFEMAAHQCRMGDNAP